MPFVTANDGVLIHYESAGSGRPVVLVPGWTMDARSFDCNVGELADRHRVITPDLRGHGRSGREPIHLTLEQTGRDLHILIEELDLSDVVLAGWSMGCSRSSRTSTSSGPTAWRGWSTST